MRDDDERHGICKKGAIAFPDDIPYLSIMLGKHFDERVGKVVTAGLNW